MTSVLWILDGCERALFRNERSGERCIHGVSKDEGLVERNEHEIKIFIAPERMNIGSNFNL